MQASSGNSPSGGPAGNEARGNSRVNGALISFSETFGMSRWAAVAAFLFAVAVVIAGVVWFVLSAPPRTLTITAGPPGSSFERIAENYRRDLASNHVTLKILSSQGSRENLQRLGDPTFQVDLGFVQTGETNDDDRVPLFSLGSVAYQPMLIFYRSATPVQLISDLAGRRLAVGPVGSGTREVAMTLLATNGIAPGGSTTLLDLDAEQAATNLLAGKVDAVFLMGDSASSQVMRSLLRAPGIELYDCVQADAYTRRLTYLNKLELPRGAIDFALDLPRHDVSLIGPTVEIIARGNLHPALSDLLLEAARTEHGRASMLQKRGEFPAPLEHNFKISADAARFYKSGKSFSYRYLPFWLASLINRAAVAFVSLVVLIPTFKMIPTLYKWRAQLRIYRRYRKLLKVERDVVSGLDDAKRQELQTRLTEIEQSVNAMHVPASFGSQFYSLIDHIALVRERIQRS